MKQAMTFLGIVCSLLMGGCVPAPPADDSTTDDKLLIFHNDSGPMCLQALDWLDSQQSQHPELVIEEHLTYETGQLDLLNQLAASFSQSQGVSTTFGYLPVIFFRGQAFSGFDDEVRDAIAALIGST